MKLWHKRLLILGAAALLFIILYRYDNKYQCGPPYGKDGVISLTQRDINQNQTVFLIDGWLLSTDTQTDVPTYIGQYANLQRGMGTPAHGQATYRLNLRYDGPPTSVSVSFPALYTNYTISLNDDQLCQGSGSAKISFTILPGDNVLSVHTTSSFGYYSGMYHPPALGSTQSILTGSSISLTVYAFALFATLTLAAFTLVLWRSPKDPIPFVFGLLCASFALYLTYFFVRALRLPVFDYWFLVQSVSLYLLCFFTICLTALLGGRPAIKVGRVILVSLIIFSLVLTVLACLSGVSPLFINLHGLLTNLYYLFVFVSLILLWNKSQPDPGWEHRFARLGCLVFGLGLVCNLFAANLFEPILLFWQFEWCALFLVALFGAMMIARNKRILTENETFQNHLEELVTQRTDQLNRLLQERKAFFADMAHDLKAPISATRSFIDAILQNKTEIDDELMSYLKQVSQKQAEMATKVQGLTTLNRFDEVATPAAPMSVNDLVRHLFDSHQMEAQVSSVHLHYTLLATDETLVASPQKMDILFENLIFNALRATPKNGSITIGAAVDTHIVFTVRDTGKGIPPDELPHIFDRFFVGRDNRATGSGLGLYIVNTIVSQMGGTITVTSTLGQGTCFEIRFPK